MLLFVSNIFIHYSKVCILILLVEYICYGKNSSKCLLRYWLFCYFSVDVEHLAFEVTGDTVHRQSLMNGHNKLFIPDWTNSVQSATGKVIRWTYTSFDTEPVHLAFFRPSADDQTLFS